MLCRVNICNLSFRNFVPGIVPLHGNPEDYAWGAGGLDAIITQVSHWQNSHLSYINKKYISFYLFTMSNFSHKNALLSVYLHAFSQTGNYYVKIVESLCGSCGIKKNWLFFNIVWDLSQVSFPKLVSFFKVST